jgi:[acyl-carrier-protein] S-malonyltransferase
METTMSKTAILFPGQGSQEPGMGRDAAEADNEAMELWIAAEKASGLPLREIYWDGESGDMADTRALQPALTVVNLSLWLAARRNLSPSAAAGHSLGEFAALAASGALDAHDVIRAVALRGRLMAEAGGEGHGMAAVVKLDRGTVEGIVDQAVTATGKELRIANYNSPAQFVISGEAEPLEAAAGLVKEARGRAIPLAVSGAFHSPLIREAADEFAAFLGTLTWKAPAFPVLHNATALPETDPSGIEAVMRRQMTSSVLWIQTLETLWLSGVRRFVEIGPKNVLAKLLTPNLKDVPEVPGLTGEWTVESVGSLEQARAL